MPDPAMSTAIEQALAEVRAARAPLDAAEARLLAALEAAEPVVPLKQAAHEMGLDEKAARKRAQRGAGLLLDGRWHFSRAYIDGVKGARMST